MANELRSRIFTKRNGGLFPADMPAAIAFDKMKDGAGYLVNLHRPRNLLHHRKLFALLNLVQENTDKWATVETLLDDLKISTGLFDTRINVLSGLPYATPKSISFASMTQDEFEEWYDKAVDLVSKQVFEMGKEDLLVEIDDILAGRRAA